MMCCGLQNIYDKILPRAHAVLNFNVGKCARWNMWVCGTDSNCFNCLLKVHMDTRAAAASINYDACQAR
eukprot:5966272-Amphidinium_carterae.2